MRVPKIMRGVVSTAFRLSFQEAAEARAAGNVEQETRAWKLFTLVTNVADEPPRGGVVSKAKLSERCDAFARGEWLLLVEASRADAQSCSTATSRRRRRGNSGDVMGRRAKRALQLTQWGELSSGRQALKGALVAPGNERTRTMLSDPSRRPPVPRAPVARELIEYNPEDQVVLDGELLLQNLRKSRRGAAAGPSGLAGEHFRVVLD